MDGNDPHAYAQPWPQASPPHPFVPEVPRAPDPPSFVPPSAASTAPTASATELDPHRAELDSSSVGAVLDALLRSPARLLDVVREGGAAPQLIAMSLVGLATTGLAMSSWSGGPQLLVVPIKLALLALVTALVCLPSLHVLAALSGAGRSLRETAGAMSMGVALASVLALALAPIAWVLSAATSSLAFAGALYLVVFLVAALFGLGLVRRALAASAGGAVRGLGAWSVMFLVVGLQLATTLRPLVGPFDGLWPHDRTSFVTHLADCLGS
jgi:hypothetical protein